MTGFARRTNALHKAAERLVSALHSRRTRHPPPSPAIQADLPLSTAATHWLANCDRPTHDRTQAALAARDVLTTMRVAVRMAPAWFAFVLVLAPLAACDSWLTNEGASVARRLQQSNKIAKTALSTHNSLRALHGSPPLTWDADIAKVAQAWAAKCQLTSSRTKGLGENLGKDHANVVDLVNDWYDKGIKAYDYDNPGYSFATGGFTQVVWRGSRKLGCGFQASCKMYVCMYYPPGNVETQFPANVLPATGKPTRKAKPARKRQPWEDD